MNTGTDQLFELLFDRIVAAELPEPVGQWLLAAYQGPAALDALDSDATMPVPEIREAREVSEPPGMYLKAIVVEGFRGIGPRAALRLNPGPGLTLVTGRNGSGKSSFAEALELALTGENMRWKGRPAAWRGGWRNLHHRQPCEISVELITEGAARATTVHRSWRTDDDLNDGDWVVQQSGSPRRQFEEAEWREPLQIFRPFLSYSELGALIDGRPSEMHDALQGLLGLDKLVEADKLLNQRRRELDELIRDADDGKRILLEDMSRSSDERARAAETVLTSRAPDLAEVLALSVGRSEEGRDSLLLRELAGLQTVEPRDVEDVARSLRYAVTAKGEVSDTHAGTAQRVADLLTAATQHHDVAGDGVCPVCRVGHLNAEWRRQAERAAVQLGAAAREARQADRRLEDAVRAAGQLIGSVPRALMSPPPGIDTAGAVAAWEQLIAVTQMADPLSVADGLVAAQPLLEAALGEVRQAAVEELTRRDEGWQPLAARIASWCDAAGAARDAAVQRDQLKQAIAWLRAEMQVLRDERLAPFAAQSADVWQRLRQESNVELGPVRLTGSASMRRVALDVTVDGVAGAALGVMSQGELHALGLALFLPRATVAESPFRFVVIDDPVQAMDPAKVEGLAQVLAEVSRTRQVVVFTHDDRLAQAVRGLEMEATIWEVCRRETSVVELKKNLDPVSRHLDDARAIANSDELPDELRRTIVPSYCRSALEASCPAAIRSRRLGRGESHAAVEETMAAARTVNQVMALALFDDPQRGGEVLGRLNQRYGGWAGDVLQACKRGAHQPYTGDVLSLITDTKRLALEIGS